MKRENYLVAIFGFIFLLSMIMIMNEGIRTTGYATSATTTSNVTIQYYFAIEMSGNLSQGIEFGSITTLPVTNQNATHNLDGENNTGDTQGYNLGTAYYLNVSDDSNTAVDFCIKADALNTSTGDEIGLGNETYSNSTYSNSTWPDIGAEISFTTSYVKTGLNIATGGENYYRFWLDVPAGTASGTYNNTVFFEGVQTGNACS